MSAFGLCNVWEGSDSSPTRCLVNEQPLAPVAVPSATSEHAPEESWPGAFGSCLKPKRNLEHLDKYQHTDMSSTNPQKRFLDAPLEDFATS